MKFTIVHLSDIHVATETDSVLGRASQICAAIRQANHGANHIVMALTGDLAYSGSEGQYLAVWGLIEAIREGLAKTCDKSIVQVITIPGNHDCDFSLMGQARKLISAQLREQDKVEVDDSTVEVLTGVQEEYFGCNEAMTAHSVLPADRLYWERHIVVEDKRVTFKCINSAWISERDETAGTIVFPIHDKLSAPSNADLVVSMLHHPYNWFTPNCAREIKESLERSSDVILTGHEHKTAGRSQSGFGGEENLYIEGGALQESGNAQTSAFNVLQFELTERKQRVWRFEWNGSSYELPGNEPDWKPYQVSTLRLTEAFVSNDNFSAWLNDLGLSIDHPDRGPLDLDDIFVYPDLKELKHRSANAANIVRGESLLGIASDSKRILVTGPDKCGRTTLAKKLYRDTQKAGLVPLYLPARELKYRREGGFRESIKKAFCDQYKESEWNAFCQLPAERRLVLLDDYHALDLARGNAILMLKDLEEWSGHVVLLANDIEVQVSQIVGEAPVLAGRISVRHFRIQAFGNFRRNELAERWFALSDDTLNVDAFARRIVTAKEMMDIIIGRNFVPSYPVMLLPILQAEQHSEQVNTSASTYGYFYELLIRRSLAEGTSREAYDVKVFYLAHLAFAVYRSGKETVSDKELRFIHSQFEEQKLIDIDFTGIVREFIKCRMLAERDGEYSFKYPYIYYYFLASHIQDKLSNPEMRLVVTDLVGSVHEEKGANTLLFLAHLSRDPYIISKLLERAKTIFEDVEAATLLPESSPLKNLGSTIKEIVFVERATQEERRTRMEALDGAEQDLRSHVSVPANEATARAALDAELDDARKYLAKVSVGFRTLQILGQMLKNFPGAIDGADKIRILDECYGVGLRSLGSLYALVRGRGDELLREVVQGLREDHPEFTDVQIQARAHETIFGLTELATYGMIRRIAHAVGSPALDQVYEAVRKVSPTPAKELIYLALQLDQLSDFPESKIIVANAELEGNPLAQIVLCQLAISHFALFGGKYDLKQRVLAKLGIKYEPKKIANPRTKLVSN